MSAHIGPRGTAVKIDIDPTLSGASTTVACWLLNGDWHPVWGQFVITVVTLADLPDVEPAKLQFPGATHELLVVALNPGSPPVKHKAAALAKGGFAGVGGFLTPVDVVHQFTATDEEMVRLVELCVKACVDGAMTPSTDDARETLREGWLSACVKTLAHMRGEEHAP